MSEPEIVVEAAEVPAVVAEAEVASPVVEATPEVATETPAE